MATARQILNALLPRGSAWLPKYDGGYDHLLDGISDCFEVLKAVAAALADLRHPLGTQQLTDLEREFGVITESGLSEWVRRTYLQSVVYAPIGVGSASDLEARLRAAGFDVYVYQNNPVINPALLLASILAASCGDPDSTCGAPLATCSRSDDGSESLLINEEIARAPVTYTVPENSKYWAMIFFVGGILSGSDWFEDWNMEWPHVNAWSPSGSALLTKSQSIYYTGGGIRSLQVQSQGVGLDDQMVWADNDDPDLYSFHRMHQGGVAVVPDIGRRNLLIDGSMEQYGVAAWTAANAVLTKEAGHEGTYCIRVTGNNPTRLGEARQTRITTGHTYRITGYGRSQDGTTKPVITSPGGVIEWSGDVSGDWLEIDDTFTAAGVSGYLSLTMDAFLGVTEFDSLVLEDVSFTAGHTADVTATTDRQSPWIRGQLFDSGSGTDIEIAEQVLTNTGFDNLPVDGWTTSGMGWSIDQPNSRAVKVAGIVSGYLGQIGTATLKGIIVPGQLYRLTYTVTDAGGAGLVNVTPYVGGTIGTNQTGAGTYTEVLRAESDGMLQFYSPFNGVLEITEATLEAISDIWTRETMTVETIVRLDTIGSTPGVYTGIASNGKSVGDGDEQYLGETDGVIQWGCVVGATARYVETTTALSTAAWYRITATRLYDGTDTTLSIYVDGALEATGTWAGAPVVTAYDRTLIGRMAAGERMDGVIADHVAFYEAAKDAAWAALEEQRDLDALWEGPAASQTLPAPVAGPRTLTAYAWSPWSLAGTAGGFPVIFVLTPAGEWQLVSIGTDTYYSLVGDGRQDISELLPDGIETIRMMVKTPFAVTDVNFDHIRIDDITMTRAQVPAVMRDKFERLILASKPVHSWAGLLVDYV